MISSFFQDIGVGIVNLIIKILGVLINIILVPINALLNFIFPDLSTIIENFYSTFNYVFTGLISYIFYYIPPMTKLLILTYILTLIAYYSVKYTYKGIILLPHLYQKIKFW